MGDPMPSVVRDLMQVSKQLITESEKAASKEEWAKAKALMALAERAGLLRAEVVLHLFPTTSPLDSGNPESVHSMEIEGDLPVQPPSGGRYPKYRVRANALVKQGRKRDGGKVYEHAVPKERYDAILHQLQIKASSHGKQQSFKIDDIQEQLDCPRLHDLCGRFDVAATGTSKTRPQRELHICRSLPVGGCKLVEPSDKGGRCMTTKIGVRPRKIVAKTRLEWAREGSHWGRYSQAKAKAGLRTRIGRGWIPVEPPGHSPHEQVVTLRRDHPIARIARIYRAGERWFHRPSVEEDLGYRLDSRLGVAAMAKAGFALLRAEGNRVELRAADPRLAHLVNCARLGPQRRGYGVHRVIEAFLALPPKHKRRRAATDVRRLEVARIMQEEWLLDGEDLLNCRRLARLRSIWTF